VSLSYSEIIVGSTNSHKERINPFCGQNTLFLKVKLNVHLATTILQNVKTCTFYGLSETLIMLWTSDDDMSH